MGVFRKRVWRGIKAHPARYVALFLLLVLMISATSGFYIVSDSMKAKNHELMSKGKVEDGQIITAFPMPKELEKEIAEEGVQLEKTYYADVAVTKKKTIRIFKNRENINKPVMTSGRLPEKSNEIALNQNYVENNHVKINDKIKLPKTIFAGENNGVFKVVGAFALPDFNSSYEKNTDVIFDALNFGQAIVSDETMKDILPKEKHYRVSYRFDDRHLSEKKTNELNKKIIEKVKEKAIIIDFIPKKINTAINVMMTDMSGDRPMMTIFMCLMIILLAFVFAVISGGTIREESEIIGTLMANGYRKKELLKFYVSTPIVITLLASIVGNIIGYTLYVNPYKFMYYRSFNLPNFELVFNSEAFIVTTVVPFVIMLIINFINLQRKLSNTPLDFIRRNIDNKKEKKKRKNEIYNIEKSKTKKFNRGKFENRFRLRIFLRNIGDYSVMMICIIVTSLLMFYGMTMGPTIDSIEKNMKEGTVSEYQYILKAPTPITGKNAEIDSKNAEKYTMDARSAFIRFKRGYEDVSAFGIEKDSKYFKDLKIPKGKNEVVISEGLSKKAGIDIGDEIVIKNKIDSKKNKYKVVGKYKYPPVLAVFFSKDNLNRELKKPAEYYNGYFSDTKLELDENMVATIVDKENVAKGGAELKKLMSKMVKSVLFVSCLFFFIIMFMLTKILMDKNSLSIAYLKVFGYSSREINRIYLRPATATLIVTLLVGIPIQVKLLKILTFFALMKFTGYIEVIIGPKEIVTTAILALAVYALVVVSQMRRISKMSFSEALKNRE